MNYSSRRVQIAFVVLVMVTLACTCRSPLSPGSSSNPRLQATVPVSDAAANSFTQKWKEAVRQSAASGGQVDVTFTEAELTSIVVRELDRQNSSGGEVPISNPQIHLSDGQMWLNGQVALSDSQTVNAQVVLKPDVLDGKLTLKITKVTLGALPVPQSMVDQFNTQIAEQMAIVNQETGDFMITAIAIREGEMQVTGQLK